VIAQRLVRKVCPDCKSQYEPTTHELRELGLGGPNASNGQFFLGKGCDKCFDTGYRGRTGIYEIMLIDEQVRELVYKKANAGEIKKHAINAGLQTLRMDGARKVTAGITTIPEVMRVTQTDII
jgi:type II secretory ATPase GspE/PulE/Tfp pilus assembly ATPase PilB-like protein